MDSIEPAELEADLDRLISLVVEVQTEPTDATTPNAAAPKPKPGVPPAKKRQLVPTIALSRDERRVAVSKLCGEYVKPDGTPLNPYRMMPPILNALLHYLKSVTRPSPTLQQSVRSVRRLTR